MKRRELFRYGLPFGSYTILLTYLLLMPLGTPFGEENPPFFDKFLHLAFFAPFGFFWIRLFHPSEHRWSLRKALFVAASASVLYGVGMEIGQGFTLDRSPEFPDAMMDLVGGGIGGWLYFALKRPPKASSSRYDASRQD